MLIIEFPTQYKNFFTEVAAAELPNLELTNNIRMDNNFHSNYIHEILISPSNEKFRTIFYVMKNKTSEIIQTTDEGIQFCY